MALPVDINGHHDGVVGGDYPLREFLEIPPTTETNEGRGQPMCRGRAVNFVGDCVRSCRTPVEGANELTQLVPLRQACLATETSQCGNCRYALTMLMIGLTTDALPPPNDGGAISGVTGAASVGTPASLPREGGARHD